MVTTAVELLGDPELRFFFFFFSVFSFDLIVCFGAEISLKDVGFVFSCWAVIGDAFGSVKDVDDIDVSDEEILKRF